MVSVDTVKMPVRKYALGAEDVYRARVLRMSASEVLLLGAPKFDLEHELQLAGYTSITHRESGTTDLMLHCLHSELNRGNVFFGKDNRVWFTDSEDAVIFALKWA